MVPRTPMAVVLVGTLTAGSSNLTWQAASGIGYQTGRADLPAA